MAFSKTINSAMDEVLRGGNNPKLENRTETGEKCTTSFNNASVQITNKIEGKTYMEIIEMKKYLIHETLKIKGLKCCLIKNEENTLFLEVENSKIKKQIFKGWIFAKNSSISGLEDAKYDISLVRCF